MSDQPEIPLVKPKDAIAFFKRKGLARSFAWQDIMRSQHDYFFTIAKMTSLSLLEDARDIIVKALEDGTSPQQIARDLKNSMAAAGWWGKQEQTDPLTGEKSLVQLGSARRVRTIVNTNLRVAYSAGRTARQERVKKSLPIGVYKSRMDGRERPQHRDWHDTALPIDHIWWDTHTGPCDWGCRCKRITMTIGQAKRRGLDWTKEPKRFPDRRVVNKRTGEIHTIERGIGLGWDYHPGKAPLEGLAPELLFPFSKIDEPNVASAQIGAVDEFLDIFGASDSGGVYTDAAGWPLAISKRWLRGFSPKAQKAAKGAALAITDPDTIALLWITNKDGSTSLVRRYRRIIGSRMMMVDVAHVYWRFVLVAPSHKASEGHIIYRRPENSKG